MHLHLGGHLPPGVIQNLWVKPGFQQRAAQCSVVMSALFLALGFPPRRVAVVLASVHAHPRLLDELPDELLKAPAPAEASKSQVEGPPDQRGHAELVGGSVDLGSVGE
ncbi:hypothetical protein B9Z19DRAFT_1133698 [Tuber borchii]|uniref:Uncharacterized protein n=1 Tax=Tuber borchii TaxID=42251 RepID=A0A2T6ZFF3_TUBBO|nr:hypothetical protein B9Z19DRAFT_1133698 [Tuber borchii]